MRLNLLCCLDGLEAVSAAQLAPKAHTSVRTVRRHLEALVELGLADEKRGKSDGETTGRPAASYMLSVSAREQTAVLFDLLSRPLGPADPPN